MYLMEALTIRRTRPGIVIMKLFSEVPVSFSENLTHAMAVGASTTKKKVILKA